MEEYRLQYPNDMCLALKHSVADTLSLYQELQNLRGQFTGGQDKNSKRLDKSLGVLIRKKERQYFDLTKFSDYAAMTMAAFPNSQFVSSYDYKRVRDSIAGPILVRGIRSGSDIKHAEQVGRDYYFIETGYLGNYPGENNLTGRKVYHRIEKNAMQQTRILDVPDDRWQALCRFNPKLNYMGWRKNPGDKILIVMSTEKPFNFYGEDRNFWIKNTIAAIQQHTNRPVVIREKSSRGERTKNTIYEALEDVWAVVAYNSIAAVEAIQAGIPSFSLAPTAARSISTTDLSLIDRPPLVNESVVYKWLSSIAYGQFTVDELVSGQAWELVQENEQRPTFSY